MSLNKAATKNHLIAGMVLIVVSLSCLFLNINMSGNFWSIGVFFFGVWGGVETGRYLESWIQSNITETNK